MKLVLTTYLLFITFGLFAQTFQRNSNESAEAFVKRIYKVEELSHPIIETNEWDSSKKVIICFIEFENDDGGGSIGYLLTPKNTQTYIQTLIDTFRLEGGSLLPKIETVFFANADKDKAREIVVMTSSEAHSPKYADNDLEGTFYSSNIYDNYNLQLPPKSLKKFIKLSDGFDEFEGVISDSQTDRLIRREKAKYKTVKAVRIRLKELGY